MSNRLARPDWVSRINLFGPAAGGTENMVALDAEEMKRTAMASTGLSDFGDLPWEEGYQRLVASLNHEAQLHTLGRLMIRGELLRSLGMRLRLADLWNRHPEVLDEKIEAPIIIAGPPRTGTSILQEIMSEDDQFHIPYAWRCLYPVPILDDPVQDRAERLRLAQCEQEFWVDIQPELQTMHEMAAHLPTECLAFYSMEFVSDYWGMVADMPAFMQWKLENQAFLATYRWHKRVLQSMQFGEPKRPWLLKSPAHLAFLDVIFGQYPDARVIHTHRDPLKSIPSTASITSTIRWTRSDNVDFKALAQQMAFGFQFSMERVIDLRAKGEVPADQIADLYFKEFIADPVETIREIYERFELRFSDELAKKIRDYLKVKPKGKHGKHVYDPTLFGLDEKQLREQFRRYSEHYGIPEETN